MAEVATSTLIVKDGKVFFQALPQWCEAEEIVAMTKVMIDTAEAVINRRKLIVPPKMQG